MSSKVKTKFDENAIKAFDLLKIKLQERMELYQPDYSKPFELTTDASNFAIGAVLTQNKNPIIFISRTLTDSEISLATNEKELLTMVWALQKLRNYLYGIADFTIFSDHQPLTFAVTEKNPNLKLKRWKAFIEESGAKVVYTPGKENIVADALSRQYCHAIENENFDSHSDSIHSTPSSPETNIQRVSVALNFFKNQLKIERNSSENELRTETVFPGYVLHHIEFSQPQDLVRNLKFVIRSDTINAIHSTEEIFYEINRLLVEDFPLLKFVFTKINRNIPDINEQEYLIITEHERAHRNYKESFAQLREKYLFPKMKQKIKAHAVNCEICKKQKQYLT